LLSGLLFEAVIALAIKFSNSFCSGSELNLLSHPWSGICAQSELGSSWTHFASKFQTAEEAFHLLESKLHLAFSFFFVDAKFIHQLFQ